VSSTSSVGVYSTSSGDDVNPSTNGSVGVNSTSSVDVNSRVSVDVNSTSSVDESSTSRVDVNSTSSVGVNSSMRRGGRSVWLAAVAVEATPGPGRAAWAVLAAACSSREREAAALGEAARRPNRAVSYARWGV
ncbi:hypothetical protein F443_12572, partial [Phytophthora nicotianae P1569]